MKFTTHKDLKTVLDNMYTWKNEYSLLKKSCNYQRKIWLSLFPQPYNSPSDSNTFLLLFFQFEDITEKGWVCYGVWI